VRNRSRAKRYRKQGSQTMSKVQAGQEVWLTDPGFSYQPVRVRVLELVSETRAEVELLADMKNWGGRVVLQPRGQHLQVKLSDLHEQRP
jgi:hypothetical protein